MPSLPPEIPTSDGLIHTNGYNYQITQGEYQSQLARDSAFGFVSPGSPSLIFSSAPPQTSQWLQNQWPCHDQQSPDSNLLSPYTIYRDPQGGVSNPGSTVGISGMGAPHMGLMGRASPPWFNPDPVLDLHNYDTDIKALDASFPRLSLPQEDYPESRIATAGLMPVQAVCGQLIGDELRRGELPHETSQWQNWTGANQTTWTGQQSRDSNLLSPYTTYRDHSPGSTVDISRMGTPYIELMGRTSPPWINPDPALDLHSYDTDIKAPDAGVPLLSVSQEVNPGSRIAITALVNETPIQAIQTQLTEDELDESESDESELDESGLDESELEESETDESGLDEMDEDQTQMDKTQMAEEHMEEEVCYGMITAFAQLLQSKPDNTHMDVDESPLEQTSIQPNIFEVTLGDAGYYVLLSPTDEPFAVLDCPTVAILQSLTSCNFPSLRFQAVCPDYPPSLTNSTETEEEEAVLLSINLNIYGLKSFTDSIGTALRVLKAYLQQPSHIDDGVEYDNPHYLKPDGNKTPWVELRENGDRSGKSGDEPSFSRILTNVLESQLTHADGLRELEAAPIVKTTLLRHQRQALDFISQREAGITKDGYSLWKKLDDDEDAMTPRYRNLLNGDEECNPPQEPRGGIIADEMGLGKTLTMISAVAASLEEASQFATLPTPDSNDSTPSTPNTKSTLIIVPLILLSQWAEQIERHTIEGSMTYFKYHGNPKALVTANAASSDSDIILTTYSKVSSEFCKKSTRESGLLYTRRWFRIILDEAHEVRNSKSNQFRAIRSLSAERRWCLTGTPIHNSLEDLAALFQFLKVPRVDTNAHFRQQITNPIKTNTHSDMRGMRNLRLLLTTYCLRRKQSCLPQMKDQKLKEIIQHLSFESDENQEYEDLKVECKNAVDKAIRSVDQQKFFSVFKAIMRLRLFCNHGIAIPSTELGGGDDSMCTHCGEQIDLESEVITKGYRLLCGHLVCTVCFSYTRPQIGTASFEREATFQCQICWKPSKVEDILKLSKNKGMKKSAGDIMSTSVPEVDGGRQCYPTKIRTLVKDIRKNPGKEKSIVFSSWVRSLVLAEKALKSAGIGYVLIDGRLKLDDRKKALKKFREDPQIMVLLMTTGTGAAGLNLTVATRVHLLEPQWNPMVEAQAIGRAARLGQDRPVTVYRYIMTTTIEENIRTRQLKKQALAEITIDTEAGTTENHMFERLTEIRSLL